jgi:hypothetical protein
MHATAGSLTGIGEVVRLPLTPTRSRCRSIQARRAVVVCSEYFRGGKHALPRLGMDYGEMSRQLHGNALTLFHLASYTNAIFTPLYSSLVPRQQRKSMFLAPKTPPRRPGPNYCVGRGCCHVNHRRCTPGHGHSLTHWTDYCLKGEDRDYALIFSQEELATSLRATQLHAVKKSLPLGGANANLPDANLTAQTPQASCNPCPRPLQDHPFQHYRFRSNRLPCRPSHCASLSLPH